jgi:nucleotide-binding universal stress UspA family protein
VAPEEIVNQAETLGAGLIVMGAKGVSNLSEKLFGHTAAHVIRHAQCDVLVVPENFVYRRAKNIVFACDYSKFSEHTMDTLKQFINLYESQLLEINVVDESEIQEGQKENYSIQHYAELPGTRRFLFGEAMTEIIDFVEEHKPDLLIMVPHEHSWMKRFFDGSHTDDALKKIKNTPMLFLRK